jgi:hypothetical protein|tara:strand:+ start:145 stop:489 length:345 start_codon:yes stop_codon:yes gene_type:complete
MNNLKMLEMALNQLKDTGDEWVNNNRGARYNIDAVLSKISKSRIETYSEQMQNELGPMAESKTRTAAGGSYRASVDGNSLPRLIIEGGMITHIDGAPVDWTFHTTNNDCEFEDE